MVRFWVARGVVLAGAVGLFSSLGWDGARAADPEAAEMLAKLGRPGDFSLAPPEVTEDAPSGWYLRADAGYSAASGAGLSVAGVPLGRDVSGAGWSAGGGIGYRFLPSLRADATLDYLSLGSAQLGLWSFEAASTVAQANVYWDIATIAGFTPYVGAGAGFAITTLDAPAALGPSGNDWRFAWSVSAGVSYAFSPDFSLDLSYRYLDLGAPSWAGGLAMGGTTAQQVRLGLRYLLH